MYWTHYLNVAWHVTPHCDAQKLEDIYGFKLQMPVPYETNDGDAYKDVWNEKILDRGKTIGPVIN